MKKIATLLVILAIAAAVIGCILGGATRLFAQGSVLKGSGNIITQTRPASQSIDAIESSRGVKVVIAETSGDYLRVEADDNLLDHVVTDICEGQLTVTIDPEIKRMNDIHVIVTVPRNAPFHVLEASSGSKITNEGCLETDRLEARTSSGSNIDLTAQVAGTCALKATSGSYIEAELTATDCTLEATSGSHVDIEGEALKCTAEVSSGSSLSARDFEVADYRIKASSGSSARIHCTEQLQARASSGASIRYSGDCTTDITRSSGGSVSHK